MSAKIKNNFTIKHYIRGEKFCRNSAALLSSFLLAFVFASIFTPVEASGAQELQYDLNSDTGWYVRVTGSASLSVDDLTATSLGQLASVKDTINVETNSPFGYRLLFSAASANLTNTSDSNAYFTPTTGTISEPIALAKNTWGFAFNKNNTGVISNGFADADKYTSASTPSVPDTSATWAAVPTTPTQISSLDDANVNTDGTDLDIYFGVNASTALASGTYTGTITYTAYSEGANDQLPTMQDFTQAKCDALTTDVATKLVDSRDLKVYNVTKLKDGNCWMTSNLALDGGRTLTPSDSDVVTNHTLPANITDGTASEYDVAQIITSDVDSKTNLYNWNAATATIGTSGTTDTVYESVCPRGWRLPNNSTTSATKNYPYLFSMYGLSMSTSTDTDGVQILRQAPFLFGNTGFYESEYRGNAAGYYWTRTPSSSTNIRVFSINDSEYRPQYSSVAKNDAVAVRCVFGEDGTNIMQNFTTTMCNNLSVSTATADNRKILQDSRDGKLYNISRLADNPAGTNNGICWMVSNLALDGADSQGNVRTLTAADSQVGGDVELAKNITNGTTSNATDVQIYSGVADDYTAAEEAAAYTHAVANDTPYGNFYNWYAATAKSGTTSTTGDAPYSICPKNWRLPIGGPSEKVSSTPRSWGSLKRLFDPSGNVLSGASVMQNAPYRVASAGAYYDTMGNPVGAANYWSSTSLDADAASSMHLNNTVNYFYPEIRHGKATGESVRCVLGE